MNAADFERFAGLSDATAIASDEAAFGAPKEFDLVLSFGRVNVQLRYWSGPMNSDRATLRIPKSGPGSDEVLSRGIDSGYFCAEITWHDDGQVFSNVWTSSSTPNFAAVAELRSESDGSGPFPRLRQDFALFVLAATLARLTKKGAAR